LLKGVTSGYNATVFAYGATGAGKTYTMLGSLDNPGIMMLTLKDLYAQIAS
jgi:kinesin family protein 18/19